MSMIIYRVWQFAVLLALVSAAGCAGTSAQSRDESAGSDHARLPKGSDLHVTAPLPVRGVLDLAGPVDLTANIRGYEGLCRDTVITDLLGGTPGTVPDRYQQASAINLLPLGIPQVLLIGSHEEFVPRPIAETYVRTARMAGDPVQLIVVPDVGHFEIASPCATPWPRVASAIRSLVDGKLP